MKFLSPVYSSVSGSVAGLTYAHNQGGLYVRARRSPTNPNTEPQQAVRSAVAFLTDAWTNTLTTDQKDSWELYAFNTPTLNKLGVLTKKSGQNMFIRANTTRLQAGDTIVAEAPTTFDLGAFSLPTALVADESAQTISFAFTEEDAWVEELGAILYVFQSRPQNNTRRFFKGPYQLAATVVGATMVPPTSPKTFNSLFPIAVDQRVFLKFNLASADGRYTDPARLDVVVTG